MAFPPPVRGLRIAAPYSSHDDERAPLIPTGTPASSTSASSDPAPTTSFPGATAAKQWSPFTRVGDVFDTWTKQGHEEPNADIDIEMAFPAASFPKPASSMLKDNSALPRWAKRRVGDGEALRFQGSSKDSGAGSSQPAASSSVASAPGQSAAESMVGAGTLSGSVMGAGSGFGSVVGTGSASGQGVTANWMETFKGLLVAYVFFVLPIILFFFPRYDNNQNHHVLQNLMDSSKISSEKVAVLVFFVIFLTAGVLGVLLAHIAQGPAVTRVVGAFTLLVIILILGFMDYILLKTMPDNLTNTLMFLSHFIVTTTIICFLWFKYVWPSSCCQGGTRQD
ncbi:uncharacterized protein LOC110431206 isoform X1 [Sorghum bicolor]|uniref:Uncharacterized protein n=1 Tax=Sorghum bicolor TaxID=4558 RepID=A0A1W0VUH6_SORBI|nr:uncharacterized protein LOC110431206 isoform X1 [Sorghum bicolor]OQU76943.1 hypothetical protein SORBI_3010G240001 [Sorghum bicolor]|eukprot:XP_021305623.1 uncharacterized protein LOC110431206 isoform X1 [Sorghum bicolor]